MKYEKDVLIKVHHAYNRWSNSWLVKDIYLNTLSKADPVPRYKYIRPVLDAFVFQGRQCFVVDIASYSRSLQDFLQSDPSPLGAGQLRNIGQQLFQHLARK